MVQDITPYVVSPVQGIENVSSIRPRKALPEGTSPFGLLGPGGGGGSLTSNTGSRPSPEGWAATVAEFDRQQERSAPERAYAALGKASLRSSGLDAASEHAVLLFASLAGGSLGTESYASFTRAGLQENQGGQPPDSGPDPVKAEISTTDGNQPESGGKAQIVTGGVEARSPERTFMGGASGTNSQNGVSQEQVNNWKSSGLEKDFSVSESARRAFRAYSQVSGGIAEIRRGTVFSAAV